MIFELLKATAWKMRKWHPYGPEHILILTIGMSFAFFLAFKLKNITDRSMKLFFRILSVYFLVTEIYKELFLSIIIENGYCWSDFPFQLCSIGMYICMVLSFSKNEHLNEILYTFLGTYNFLGGLAAFFEPTSMFYGYITMTIHSVVWHFLLIFSGLLMIFSEKMKYRKSLFIKSTVLYICLSIIAFILNAVFMDISSDKMNLFFIGPGISPIIVFREISVRFGMIFESVFYTFIVITGAFIIYIISYYMKTLLNTKKTE